MPRRIEELDALRGLMLVWITCTHLPTILSKYTNQPFGFFAATEGFIFLSALFPHRRARRLWRNVAEIMDANRKAVLLPVAAAGVCVRDRSPDCGARQQACSA